MNKLLLSLSAIAIAAASAYANAQTPSADVGASLQPTARLPSLRRKAPPAWA